MRFLLILLIVLVSESRSFCHALNIDSVFKLITKDIKADMRASSPVWYQIENKRGAQIIKSLIYRDGRYEKLLRHPFNDGILYTVRFYYYNSDGQFQTIFEVADETGANVIRYDYLY